MRIYRPTIDGKPALAREDRGILVALSGVPDAPRAIEGALPFDRAAVPVGAVLGPVGDADLLPPLCPGKIVAIGLNYQDHIDEAAMQAPERPVVFTKGTERP
jgi:2-keto-4-pentenoate hydratase/2-oxohepta-3-ene-1,7-dioic acid hydratase in catechol pathway